MNRLGPYRLGPNDTPENGIYCGDARELAKAIPDESVDLIFTDPVYQNIDDYRWLAETAARVLKVDGACLAFFGIGYLPETIKVLGNTLCYRWTLGVFQPNGPSRRGAYRCFSKWYGCLWYDKNGTSKPAKHFPDMLTSIFRPGTDGHKWRKNPRPLTNWLDAFTLLGAIVLDPFTGGGTVPAACKMLGCRYLACEIESGACEMARERVRNTQPPLLYHKPEQLPLLTEAIVLGDA